MNNCSKNKQANETDTNTDTEKIEEKKKRYCNQTISALGSGRKLQVKDPLRRTFSRFVRHFVINQSYHSKIGEELLSAGLGPEVIQRTHLGGTVNDGGQSGVVR